MTITKNRDGSTLTVALEGRMDAVSAPQLEEALKAEYETITDLTLDLEKLTTPPPRGFACCSRRKRR